MSRGSVLTVVGVLLALLVITIPAAAQQSYVVQPGDTLYSIAQKYDITTTALAAYNNITNPNLLYAGTTILIPPASGTPGGSTGGTGNPPSSTTIRYIVKAGDTLSAIAVRYNTTVQAIRNANGLTSNVIYPNQGLWITPGVYVPPVVSPPAPPTAPSGQYYWVQQGDNLFAIGLRFGVNIYRIAEANGILNLNRIYAGVPLLIPR